jgi:hypothetical protein
MGVLGRGARFRRGSRTSSGWSLGFPEEAVQGPNFEFRVVLPKILSVSVMDGYYFKEMVSREVVERGTKSVIIIIQAVAWRRTCSHLPKRRRYELDSSQ